MLEGLYGTQLTCTLNTKVGPICSGDQSSLHYFWIQSLFTGCIDLSTCTIESSLGWCERDKTKLQSDGCSPWSVIWIYSSGLVLSDQHSIWNVSEKAPLCSVILITRSSAIMEPDTRFGATSFSQCDIPIWSALLCRPCLWDRDPSKVMEVRTRQVGWPFWSKHVIRFWKISWQILFK